MSKITCTKEERSAKIRSAVKDYTLILLGSILYAISTILFIFPSATLLGGTSGISVILTSVLPFSPGVILMVINFSLIILAFPVLGRDMAIKTLVGSVAPLHVSGFSKGSSR